MIPTKTENQEKRIANNIVKACNNIELLNKQGYDFIYLASGFIAHYNINGFVYYYQHNSLKEDIIRHASSNQYDNFRKGEKNFEYYMQQKKIYNMILAKIT